MFRKTVHPLDLVLAVLVAVLPGAAIFYGLAINGRLPFDMLTGLSYLVVAASVMLAAIGGMVSFAVWFFSPKSPSLKSAMPGAKAGQLRSRRKIRIR